MPRIDALLRDARVRLKTAGKGGTDAEWLLAHVLERPRTWLYAHADQCVEAAQLEDFADMLARRLAGEPVAYLTGACGFWGLDLRVTRDTLIPRPETELLVELALARLAPERVCWVAELGTGSGAIALALAHERPDARVVATDADPAALAVARANASHLGLDRIDFRLGDWLAPLVGECFDMILGNPPYIAAGDLHLAQDDLRHEPLAALVSGSDGLDAIGSIVGDAHKHLVPGGWLLLEHAWGQGQAVRTLLTTAGFSDVASERDLEDRDRVSLGRLRN